MIFISHSSKDNIVSYFVIFLTSLGINPNDIFCSSLEGNGVKNGKRINDVIKQKMNESNIVVYLISHNFLKSAYCLQELGAMWLGTNRKCFLFKFDDVEANEMNGFIDSDYKYSLLNTDGLSSLYDEICELYNLKNKQAVISRAISNLLVNIKKEIKLLVEDKDKTEEELERQKTANLENQYEDLSIGEKIIIGSIFFSIDAVGYYQLSNGTVRLLERKGFVFMVSNITIGLSQVPFALQPLVIKFIKKNEKVYNELINLLKENSFNLNGD